LQEIVQVNPVTLLIEREAEAEAEVPMFVTNVENQDTLQEIVSNQALQKIEIQEEVKGVMCATIAVLRVTSRENVINQPIQIASDVEVQVTLQETVLKRDKIQTIVTSVESQGILPENAQMTNRIWRIAVINFRNTFYYEVENTSCLTI